MDGFSIGNVNISNKLVMAPMAGVTDITFRNIIKSKGAGLIYSEMVSAMALMYSNLKTYDLLKVNEEERPVSVQIFGSDPKVMAKAAVIVSEYADVIDINMGCPAPKIVKNGEGSALMRDPELAYEITKSVVKASSIPVTVKIRKGWNDESINGVEMAKSLASAGASAIAIHARTSSQYYSGSADWDYIRKVVEAVDVPVIGNGDVKIPSDAKRMLDETGCTAVMIGRAVLGNPWIFEETLSYFDGGHYEKPNYIARVDMALYHLKKMVEDKGERSATSDMRKHLAWYIKGLKQATSVRDKINTARSIKEIEAIFADYIKGYVHNI